MKWILEKNAPNAESFAKFAETIITSEAMKALYGKHVESLIRSRNNFSGFYEN